MSPQERRWRPDWPCAVGAMLRPHRRGAGDPTYRLIDDVHWRAIRTPVGPATLAIASRDREGAILAQAWGEGAAWALDSLPGLLGAADDSTGFEPRHPVIEESLRGHPHLRFGRTDLVMEALFPAIVEQKVTGKEAFSGFRRLVQRFGELAPGPGADHRLRLQPTPAQLAAIPSWEWLAAHVDPARSKSVIRAARVAGSLERIVGLDGETADRRLRSLPGIGVWTAAEVRQRALGDPDAVSFGDYHVAKQVGWAITGADFTDEQLAEFLEPWRGHRQRVVILALLSGRRRPRRGPRMSLPTHYPRPIN